MFVNIRNILELAYFASGIVIAGAAFLVLKQIKLTKQIAIINGKRESLKFAAERCQYFAEVCVKLSDNLSAEKKKLSLNQLAIPVSFEVNQGEIIVHQDTLTEHAFATEFAQIAVASTQYLNSLEAFAIPFVAGVADENLGFQEASVTFCKAVQEYVRMFQFHRKRQGVRYESCIKLYETWSTRIRKSDLEKELNKINYKKSINFDSIDKF